MVENETCSKPRILHVSEMRLVKKILFALLFALLFPLDPIQISHSQPNYSINLSSSEQYGGSANKGSILINDVVHDIPSTARLAGGLYIIRYVPDPDYKFSHWQLEGIEFTSKSESENPNLVSVTSSGELRAFYVKQPNLRIKRATALCGALFSESPIRLEVEITDNGVPIPDAEVVFYVDGEWSGTRFSDAEGRAYIDFEPSEEGVHAWYVRAEKEGFSSTTCEEWEFVYGRIELKPPDDCTISLLPKGLSTSIELNGIPVEDASVFFYVDDEYRADALTQSNGCASYPLDDLSPGHHTWYATAWIPGYTGRFSSETRSFTYRPDLSVYLVDPEEGENLGEVASDVELRATASSGSKTIQGANCSFYVDGSYMGSALSDEWGQAALGFSPPEEDEVYSWYVTVSKPGCANDTSPVGSFYYPVQPPCIEVDEVFSSRGRADVGGVQEIGFHLRWKNGTDVSGAEIRITDDQTGETDERGWVSFGVTSDEVCDKRWEILELTREGMGPFRHNDMYPKIIWDRVRIHLNADKGRIDVGSNATITEEAYYEYDEAPFQGSIVYNEEPCSDGVQEKKIKVEDIHDEEHNLTAFSSDEISLIWDKVKLHIDVTSPRVQAGSEAEITYTGTYEYDGSPFEGSVVLDRNPEINEVGEVTYTVIGIEDDLYDLSSFESNRVSCIFDEVECVQDVSTATPSRLRVETSLSYAYDGRPVEDADVEVNGVGDYVGQGVYRSDLISFFPFMKVRTEIVLDGFEARIVEKDILLIGNAGLFSGAVIFTLIILGRKYFLQGK